MKPRHAAALALVGWYLMVPPYNDNDLKPQTGVPLYEWEPTGAPAQTGDEQDEPFLTLVECEARKAALKQSHLDEAKKHSGALGKMFLRLSESVGEGRCIRSDDPRLKGK
jgi:hypothetical protein